MRIKSISELKAELDFCKIIEILKINFLSESSTYVSVDEKGKMEAKFEGDAIIYPNVFILGKSEIGKNCVIEQGVNIENSYMREGCVIESNVKLIGAKLFQDVRIKSSSVIEKTIIMNGVQIGPSAYIRQSTIFENSKIGFTAEVTRSIIGRESKAMHHSYIGDSIIGEEVNVGAGAITCNFDGREKHQTKIGKRVFIGSNACLIAPITVPDDCFIGAGAILTKKDAENLKPEMMFIRRCCNKDCLVFKKRQNKKRGTDQE
ncbi:MAG: hypothetical protein HYV52_03335 [Parcubacteria group bacterium]|nr:hypothetical protein [Parcubacteria group bacterium]